LSSLRVWLRKNLKNGKSKLNKANSNFNDRSLN
jgi:hypothetical protein